MPPKNAEACTVQTLGWRMAEGLCKHREKWGVGGSLVQSQAKTIEI